MSTGFQSRLLSVDRSSAQKPQPDIGYFFFTVATRPSCASLFTHQTRGFPSPPRGGGGISVSIEDPCFHEIFGRMFFTAETKIHNVDSMNVYLNFLHSSRGQLVLRIKTFRRKSLSMRRRL
jgi:hypothetical protein